MPVAHEDSDLMKAYIARIQPDVLQEPRDHCWTNLVRHYFELPHFGVEREAYVEARRAGKRANIVVTNLVNGTIHKALVIEAKRFPRKTPEGWENKPTEWNKHLPQLKTYMTTIRREFGNVQDIFGILAIGDKLRFYRMKTGNQKGDLEEFQEESRIFDLHHQGADIGRQLIAIRDYFRPNAGQ